MTMVNSFPQKMNLSFSGCGFLCVYHAGVAAAIKEYAPQLTQNKISGASAGAIVAAALICDVCISKATSTILKVVTQARSRSLGPLHPAFNLLSVVREEMEKTLPANAYKMCTGRLLISLTRWSDSKNVVVDEYDSNEELIDAIMCSCFIPFYCGYVAPTYRGVAYIDGGFTDNQPVYDDHSVSVCPFSGESDICPLDSDSDSLFSISFARTSIRFTARNLFRLTTCLMPASTEDCSKMCLQGFEDTLRFLARNGMVPCIRCLTIQTDVDQLIAGMISIADDGREEEPSPTNQRNRLTSSRGNRRLETSECEVCGECNDHTVPTDISNFFPKILRRTFEDAVAAENSMFKYLLSFRMVRYARTALGISKLPLDMAVLVSENLLNLAVQTVAPKWLIEHLQNIVDFIMSEVEFQKSRYSRFSCTVALTEIEQNSHAHNSVHSREMEFEPSNEALQELAALRERDRRRNMASKKKTTAKSDDPNWVNGSEQDSLEHVIEYTQHHDAMYEFHYLDENNKMRHFELFNLPKNHANHAGHSHSGHAAHSPASGHCCKSPSVHNHRAQRPVTIVPEEKEPKDNENHPIHDDADSGLSGIEQASSNSESVSRRDACCSPVRHFSPSSSFRSGSNRTKTGSKRHGSFSSAHSSGRRHHLSNNSRDQIVTISSDSEADAGDRLFVPSRRLRRPANEYDGELETSDTDVAC